jgi:hypothetical protein
MFTSTFIAIELGSQEEPVMVHYRKVVPPWPLPKQQHLKN